MTAPDHFAKTELNPFAGGGRPHMNFEMRAAGRSSRAERIRKITARGWFRKLGEKLQISKVNKIVSEHCSTT